MPVLEVEMLKIQINTMEMLLGEFDFLPIYRADLAGSRTLSFADKMAEEATVMALNVLEMHFSISRSRKENPQKSGFGI